MKPNVAQLNVINSRLPGTRLDADAVEVLPFRVFDSELTDRYTEMTKEMMRKLERDLNEGRAAFNTLHRSSTTLPIGRSVNAKIVSGELHANMYAVVKRPDGTVFEEGKDVVDRYNTGAVYACSAGVLVGFYKCSICGNDIRSWNDCEHIPGRTYMVDEQPKLCIAYMTGRNIVNGVAEDCGIYEVSAVTAGGSLRAGILTSTFGQYNEGADPAEFKKMHFEKETGIETQIVFQPYYKADNKEDESMSLSKEEVKSLIDESYSSTVVENTKLKLEKEQFEKTVAGLNTKLEELTAEYDKLVTGSKETTEAFEAAKKALEIAETFKSGYQSLVETLGVKIGKEADYAAMAPEQLQATYDAYLEEFLKLPQGQVSTDVNETQVQYAGLPDEAYKM